MSLILAKVVFLFFSLIFFLIVVSFANGNLQDHKTLVFHHCSSQKLEHSNDEYMDARNILFEKLHTRSSRSKFDRTFVLVGDQGSLSGVFQCRQDLDDHKCNECMKTFLNISNSLCGDSKAARIQLSGCHVKYEADGYNDNFSLEDNEFNNHKKCGENQVVVSREYFEQMRSQAMEALEAEVANEGEGRNGFYSINHEAFHAMAQCEVGLHDHCDCANCIVEAVEVIEKECTTSISGQVFLELCYLRYEFNPHGLHGFHADKGRGTNFGKIAAISIGGVAFLFVVFMLSRCLKKKDDDD
ncbi:Cysteine-rich repeat secretory protein 11 [Bienertia sinuspersici]